MLIENQTELYQAWQSQSHRQSFNNYLKQYNWSLLNDLDAFAPLSKTAQNYYLNDLRYALDQSSNQTLNAQQWHNIQKKLQKLFHYQNQHGLKPDDLSFSYLKQYLKMVKDIWQTINQTVIN